MVSTILTKIVNKKIERVREQKSAIPLSVLESSIPELALPRNFSGALWGPGVRLIAEAKKSSPSKGLLRSPYNPVSLACTYAENGAAAISVLTESDHFDGSLDHLTAVKNGLGDLGLPVLRKDFIFDPYQVVESRVAGADAILLIVGILDVSQIKELLGLCQSLWMQALVEIHSEKELDIALDAGADIIGINNRDLSTFETDVSLSQHLRPLIPEGKIVVAESGIKSREDINLLKKSRIDAVLVGEAIMTAKDVGTKVRELVGS